MQTIKTDEEAWVKYPNYRKWFNKLYLSDLLKYDCGPSGISPSKSGEYIVRPIYNLSGMGLNAEVKYIEAGDLSKVPPGYFWCEYFEGNQYSVTYEFYHGVRGEWQPINCWKGTKNKDNLYKFTKWEKSNYYPKIPYQFNELSDIGIINVEFIEDKPIEVHLRVSPDPDCDVFIPVWESDDKKKVDKFLKEGYSYLEKVEGAHGFLTDKRLGFLIK